MQRCVNLLFLDLENTENKNLVANIGIDTSENETPKFADANNVHNPPRVVRSALAFGFQSSSSESTCPSGWSSATFESLSLIEDACPDR